MKKSIVLMIVLVLGILLAIFIVINSESVDSAISKLTSSAEYTQMSNYEKKEAVEKLLKRLKNQGKIRCFSYLESSMLYSFEYSNGVLGGIMIKGWDPYMN